MSLALGIVAVGIAAYLGYRAGMDRMAREFELLEGMSFEDGQREAAPWQ